MIAKSKPVYINGHYCGYVAVDRANKFYGKDMWDDEIGSIKVYGGVTYAASAKDTSECITNAFDVDLMRMWVFGFDTAHYGDIQREWTYEQVQKEIDKLADQLDDDMCMPDKTPQMFTNVQLVRLSCGLYRIRTTTTYEFISR